MQAIGKDYRPLCYVQGLLLTYHKEALYLVEPNNGNAKKVCDFIIEDSRRFICFCSFGERLAHITAYCGIEVLGGAIVAFNRGVYFIDVNNKRVRKEHVFMLHDMRRPLNFYQIQGVFGFDDMVVCPDYSFNINRFPTSIYGRMNDGTWEVIYSFPIGAVRHIHSVISDPYRNRVLILTGDFGDECGIWEAKDNFTQVQKIVGSSQKYRACCAKAYPEGVAFVTDSPFDQNYVFFIVEDQTTGNTIIEKNDEIPGPTVFFTYYKNEMIFATDVEYDEIKVKGLLKYFSYRRGPGVKDWYTHLFIGNPYKGYREIIKFKKDVWPMVPLGFGNICFPNGEIEGAVFFYPTAVKKVNQKLCVMRYSESGWIV